MKNVCYIVLLSAFCAGCSSQDLGGGIRGPLTDSIDRNKPFVKKNQDVELKNARQLAKVLAEWSAQPSIKHHEYHIGVDDVLELNILSLEEPGKTSKLLRTVNLQGNIKLPWIGDVPAGSHTAREVEKDVADRLRGRYIKNPEVSISVSLHKSAPVVITGAVSKPGIYYLNRDKKTILEVLAEADGLLEDASSELLIIRGGNSGVKSTNITDVSIDVDTSTNRKDLITVNLDELINEGNLRMNLWVQGGDVLNIVPRGRNYIYVLGYVQRSGMFEINREKPLGVVHAVALAGGLTPSGRGANTSLIRETQNGQQVIPVDLTKITRGVRPQLYMQPGDTLLVGSSFWAKLSEFVKPTVSAGMSVTPGAMP